MTHADSNKQREASTEEQRQVLAKALVRTALALALSRKELCAIIGISEASASRLYDGKWQVNPNSKEGELAVYLIRIFRGLDALLGGQEQQVQQWLRAQNHALGSSPITAMTTIFGLIKVLNYLDAMRGKL